MNKKHIITSISIVIVLLVGIYLLNFNNESNALVVSKNNKKIGDNIAIMLETSFGSGTYEQSEQVLWPTRGYVYNAEKTYCENGSEVSFNETTHKVSINSRLTDKCYVYFDVEPPDIILTLNNAPTTYGKTITPSCTGATVTYDNKLNQLEVTTMNSDKMKCRMNYTTPSGTTALNTYITSLSGTTQGDGQLIHEIGEVPDYSSSTIVKSFATTPDFFRNTGYSSTTQTEVDSFWTFNTSTGVFTSDPSKMTTSGNTAYYHAYMKVSDNGFYKICYTIAQSPNTNNQLYIFKNTSSISTINSSTSAQVGENCIDLNYITTTDYINISERGYSGTSSPEMTFRLEKANNTIQLDTGYRYQGKNPNNYVMFNNELWRIIGVFDSATHGQNGLNLVKIIRNDTLGGYSWNSNNNYWIESRVAHLLNYQYYDWNLYSSEVNNYCYTANSVKKACDFTRSGIKDGYRNMIANVSWYLGGGGKSGYTSYTPYFIYSYERDSGSLYFDGTNTRNLTSTMKIGLMYASDYLLSGLSNDCSRLSIQTSLANQCKSNNWLFRFNAEYTIDNNTSGKGSVWFISSGNISSNPSSNAYSIRPVLYLKADVYKVSGTGSITDPYIIGM